MQLFMQILIVSSSVRTQKSTLQKFAELAIFHLSKCGYPLCPGDIMATNPKWRQPFSTWIKYFNQWIIEPAPKELLNATIFFDFRAGFGDEKLAVSLRNHLIDIAPKQDVFCFHLARQCQANKVPLSFFKNFIVERDGEQRNRLDIKLRGLIPIIGFARVLALKYGLKETNTISRLQALQGEGRIPVDICSSAVKAYELQMHFRIIHQLEQIESGRRPDNFIEPENMTEMERTMLKDGFGVIEKLQVMLDKMFPVT
jgi:CBS domain-containing protein